MELTTNNRQTALTAEHDERHRAIMRKYGDLTALHSRWAFRFADYIADNLERSADVPALVMMRKTYGNEAIAAIIESHLGAALQTMGIINKFDPAELHACADALTNAEDAQLMNFARVLAFFVWLKRGGYELHGYNNYQLMRAFNAYAAQSMQAQRTQTMQAEREQERARLAEMQANSITFGEYCRRTGYTGKNPLKM